MHYFLSIPEGAHNWSYTCFLFPDPTTVLKRFQRALTLKQTHKVFFRVSNQADHKFSAHLYDDLHWKQSKRTLTVTRVNGTRVHRVHAIWRFPSAWNTWFMTVFFWCAKQSVGQAMLDRGCLRFVHVFQRTTTAVYGMFDRKSNSLGCSFDPRGRSYLPWMINRHFPLWMAGTSPWCEWRHQLPQYPSWYLAYPRTFGLDSASAFFTALCLRSLAYGESLPWQVKSAWHVQGTLACFRTRLGEGNQQAIQTMHTFAKRFRWIVMHVSQCVKTRTYVLERSVLFPSLRWDLPRGLGVAVWFLTRWCLALHTRDQAWRWFCPFATFGWASLVLRLLFGTLKDFHAISYHGLDGTRGEDRAHTHWICAGYVKCKKICCGVQKSMLISAATTIVRRAHVG